MMALWILIGFSIVLAVGAGSAYFWANASGQFDDLDSPSERLILEDFEIDTQLKEEMWRSKKIQ
jgi:cbb3-type cytochrome oxidase maturation protein